MTTILDLADIDAPLMICGGAYGNLEALEALDGRARQLAIPGNRIVHTGDVAAYCADAAAASAFVRARGWLSIKGNVEEQLAAGAGDCACGFAEDSVCNAMSAAWFAHADRTISPDDRRWMAGLPARLAFTMAGRRFMVVHGAVDQTNRFMFESLDEATFSGQLDLAGCDAVIAGHTGLPFTRFIGDRLWHNSGGLGMPANDATPRVWYSLVAPVAGGIRFSHHPLDYDHASAAAKMRAAGLPQGYADALRTGLWPSLDILPGPERRRTGKAITPQAWVWRPRLAQAV